MSRWVLAIINYHIVRKNVSFFQALGKKQGGKMVDLGPFVIFRKGEHNCNGLHSNNIAPLSTEKERFRVNKECKEITDWCFLNDFSSG